jgi:hypothetical protein
MTNRGKLSEKTVKRAEKVEKRDEKKNEKAENIPGKEKEIKIVKEILNEEPVIGYGHELLNFGILAAFLAFRQ